MLMDQLASTDENGNRRFRLDELRVDPGSGRIEGAGGQEQVDPRIMEVLVVLARHPGELVTREHLLGEVWRDRVVSDETLTHCVYQLRGHLQAASGDARYRNLIKTLPKRGYCLDGVVEHAGPDSGAGQTPERGPRSRASLFAVLFVAIAASAGGFLAFDWMISGQDPPSPANSIAVLPFDDFSPDGDQAYLADGFAEELIDVLTRIPGLRVTARTSSFSVRGANLDIPTIAEKLDVAYLLEGSVRKVGDEIRITTQLVDADANSHLWSVSYDRQLTDILAIQSEIARSVADALHLTLSEPAISVITPPRDPKAYELYLQGQFFWNRRAPGDEELAGRHFRRAVQIDPDFARAWVGLAGVYWVQADYSDRGRATLKKMGEALDRALAIDPELPEAHARAAAYHWAVGNACLRHEHWRKARERGLEPGRENWLVLSYSAHHAIRKGEYERALRISERVLEIDPLSAVAHGNHGFHLMAVGRFDEATAAFDKSVELNPAMAAEHDIVQTFILALTGRHEEAIARAQDWPDGPDRDQVLAKSNYLLGRKEASEEAVDRLRARPGGDAAMRLAEVAACLGQPDAAFDWLAKFNQRVTEDENRTWALDWQDGVRMSAWLRPLRDDPRWEPMLESLPERPPIDLPGETLLSEAAQFAKVRRRSQATNTSGAALPDS